MPYRFGTTLYEMMEMITYSLI